MDLCTSFASCKDFAAGHKDFVAACKDFAAGYRDFVAACKDFAAVYTDFVVVRTPSAGIVHLGV